MIRNPRKLVVRFEQHERPAQLVANGWSPTYRVAVLECGHSYATDFNQKRMACYQCPGALEVGRVTK
jgi:hypothetical protein